MTARNRNTNVAPRGVTPEYATRYTFTCNAARFCGTPCRNAWQDPLVGPTDEARGRAAVDGWTSGRYRLPSGFGMDTWSVLDLCPEHALLAPPSNPPTPYLNEEPMP